MASIINYLALYLHTTPENLLKSINLIKDELKKTKHKYIYTKLKLNFQVFTINEFSIGDCLIIESIYNVRFTMKLQYSYLNAIFENICSIG